MSTSNIRETINNSELSHSNAMPMKDTTSVNESRFSRGRKLFMAFAPTTRLDRYDGNRDASSVIERKKALATGKGSYNENGQATTFTDSHNTNVLNSALRRTRSGGAVAPPKKGATTAAMV